MIGQLTSAVVSATLLLSTSPGTLPGTSHPHVNPGNSATSGAMSLVTGLAVTSRDDGVDIVVHVDSGTAIRHFTLESPSRVVLDIADAALAMDRHSYDGRERGPVRNIRTSQFRSDTVRIVIELTSPQQYRVIRDGRSARVAFDGSPSTYADWGAGESLLPLTDALNADALLTTQTDPVVQTAAATLDLPPVASEAPVAKRQQQQKPRIAVTFDGTDIRDVIATFASFSGRTIVVGKNVAGSVTAEISDKPWDLAFQAILQAQGLAATEDASGIITVDTYQALASNQALEPLVTQILDINYAKATALRGTVQALLARDCTGLTTMSTGRELGMPIQNQQGNQQSQMGGQGCVVRGSVTADSATNKLIISEVPSRLPEIISRIQELDVRTQQVAIRAKIVFVNRTGIQDIGLAYDLGTGSKQFFQQLVPRTDPSTLQRIDTDGDGVPDALGGGTPFQGPARIALGGNAIAGIANANNAIKPNALNLIYSTALGKYQLTAFLNALQTSSLADVQSEPSVTILNNRTATIFVGQEIPIRVIDASAGGQGGGMGAGGGGQGGAQGQPNAAAFFPRATVSKEEAGIKLTVTPQITNNRMVLLDIEAENSSAELSNTDVGVVFNRQRAESKVLVSDGEAAVIGGLTVTERTKFRSGIPFLMDLPLIGRLFSQNTTNETKRDLLILVTPHILEDGVAGGR